MTAPYPRYVEPPPMWTAQEWDGTNTQPIADFLAAHGIDAGLAASGSILYLLMGSSSPTYAAGTSIVLRCNGTGWSVDAARASTAGLSPYSDFYVS